MPDYISIPLSCGKHAVIDAADWPLVAHLHWYSIKSHSTYYAVAKFRVDGKPVDLYLHRVIMQPPDGVEVDHRDRDGLNCRRSNMRIATHQQNCCNRRRPINSKAPYRGVSLLKGYTRWLALIRANGKRHYLGYHDTPEDAARAYDEAAKRLHGEFASLNFPEEGSAGA